MQTPASRYALSTRPYDGLEELDYPGHDWAAVITTCERICYQRRKINVSQVFLPGRRWGSSRPTSTSGSSPSCTTTWGILTTRRVGSSRSPIRLGPRCYPCARNDLLPVQSEWTNQVWRPHRDSNPGFSLERAAS